MRFRHTSDRLSTARTGKSDTFPTPRDVGSDTAATRMCDRSYTSSKPQITQWAKTHATARGRAQAATEMRAGAHETRHGERGRPAGLGRRGGPGAACRSRSTGGLWASVRGRRGGSGTGCGSRAVGRGRRGGPGTSCRPQAARVCARTVSRETFRAQKRGSRDACTRHREQPAARSRPKCGRRRTG